MLPVKIPVSYTHLNIIRDKGKKFIYPERAERQPGIRYRERKFYRLLYRMANYLEAQHVLCFSAKPENVLLYLSEVGEGTKIVKNEPGQLAEADFISVSYTHLIKSRIKIKRLGRDWKTAGEPRGLK